MACPRGLSFAHIPETLKSISGPFKAVSTKCNLHFSSRGVTKAKTLGGPEPKLKAGCPSS
jgi:hypothetical protein